MHNNLFQQLDSGITTLGLTLNEDSQHQLMEFLHFLQKWNAAYNLTAIRSLDNMLTHHVLDSLSIAPYVTGHSVLDLGTGAGFPGVPLAFYFPDKKFMLLDSNGKKIRFLLQAQTKFALKNITPVQERVEKLLAPEKFDVIICRAVGKISNLIEASQRLLKTQGHWLFMKGTYPQEELQAIAHPYTVHPITVPGVDAMRHVVLIDNV
ncbi:MAG: hypothetical protein A3F41_07415 [Coxiella sp. RIFCSPHIGHO2_12_FULL_44_14]|nr:MAG: hypothetical protein A3F41_07415 [Coxiella sp. RIFCSPHIGHO2_12_FULL_44_14]